ncbi:MAG: Hsp70 family protein [Myxococcales bacterium]|nr:Hsp70 family protein [Myxococcales bacterium]
MAKYVGIDFGTTNSAVAVAAEDGKVEMVSLPVPGGQSTTWRTILYFEPSGNLTAGPAAIARYLETQGEGRLVQSIKSHLASESFSTTMICGRRWTLEDMIAAYLRKLREGCGVELGRRCVIGRPVRYWGARTAADDARAVSRMREALGKAGFDEVVFEYEPNGAAARYSATLDHEELIVVADYGGGTTDFSVVRVGPRVSGAAAILATGGIAVSGDAFDARIIDAVVAPALGRGSSYRDEMGGEAPVPAWLYGHLRRWHYLSFLKSADTQRLLARVVQGTLAPELIDRLVTLIEEDLGLALHRGVEGCKVRLSGAKLDRVAVDEGLGLDVAVPRGSFEEWISEDLSGIDETLDQVLADAGVEASQIDRVFATGGSSLVPAVRQRLIQRFGAHKLVGGDELTSVAWGLAVRARQELS